jgi:hypothetical protein
MRPFVPALVVIASLGVACSDELFPHDGTAVVQWTIEGKPDPELCSDHSARFVHIVVRGVENDVVVDDWAECRDLSSSYILRRGWHRASLTLTDATRAPLVVRDSSSFFVGHHVHVIVVVDLTPPTIDLATQTARR